MGKGLDGREFSPSGRILQSDRAGLQARSIRIPAGLKPERLHPWRVEKEIFVSTARTGEGARIAGGRWNSPGLAAIYCGESLALSVLEILVHAATAEERADPRVWFALSLPREVCRTVAIRSTAS